jgi:hypothetical protein
MLEAGAMTIVPDRQGNAPMFISSTLTLKLLLVEKNSSLKNITSAP